MHRLVPISLLVALAVAAPPPSPAQTKAIDLRRSTLVIHVGKSGVFSAAGHDHSVSAPIASGEITATSAHSVNFTVDAHRLKVKPDPKVNEKDEAEIQQTMQQKVLESDKFPLIEFRSSSVVPGGSGSWSVTGKLTLHGVTKSIVVVVKEAGDAYSGNARIKQTDFGIKLVSAGSGAVNVKDEVEVQFKI